MEFVTFNKPRISPHTQIYHMTKRVIDVLICLLILPFALTVMAICAMLIYLDSGGPILFLQERCGKGGRTFKIYKFRTMKTSFENSGPRAFMKAYIRGEIESSQQNRATFKPVQDNQITRVGRILRKTSLDELPQIINVLKGEMSIVGPRPNVIWEVEEYRPWHYERLEVLPGITGLAQVRGRSCIDFTSLVRYDIEYIENQSLLLDIKVLWLTFTNIVIGKGAL